MKKIISLFVFILVLFSAGTGFCQDAEDYYDSGYKKFTDKNYDGAISDFTKAIDIKPDFFYSYAMRAMSYFSLNQVDKAITDITKAIELNSTQAFFYASRGSFYEALEKYDAAVPDYDKAIEIEPNNDQFYSNRGRIYLNLKKYDKSLKDLNKAIELNPENGNAYYYRGTVKYLTDKEPCSDWKRAKALGNTDVQLFLDEHCD